MIRIFSVKNEIKVVLTFGGVVNNYTTTFTQEDCSEVNAALRVENLQNHLRDTLKAIREKAYESGWSDAKAKKKKQTLFSGWWSA